MLRNFIDSVTSYFISKRDNKLDPRAILHNAAQEMHTYSAAVHQQVDGIKAQMETLNAVLKDQEKRIADLDQQIDDALREGNTDLTRWLAREKNAYQETVAQTRTAFERAKQAMEVLEASVKNREKDIRDRTTEALEHASHWTPQTQSELDETLHKATFEDGSAS